jgi:transposase-like protein
VRWYLEYKLSSRDIVRLMAERKIKLVHTTVLRWVKRYAQNLRRNGSSTSTSLALRGALMRVCHSNMKGISQ